MSIIERLHKKRFILRDIKPSNIAVGFGERAKFFYIQDLFHAKKYWDPVQQVHIPYREGKDFRSNPRFASTSAHLGIELSRRDDLEMISYTLLYLLKKSLPWDKQAVTGNAGNRYEGVLLKKIEPSDDLFEGFPYEFSVMLKYAKSLRFEEKPDYAWLGNNFRELFKKLDLRLDHNYDWNRLQVIFLSIKK